MRALVVVLLAAAVALPAVANGAGAGDRCGTVAADGATYGVKVVEGEIGCAAAVSALQAFLDESEAPAGFTCVRGKFGDPYGAQCANETARVQALNRPRMDAPRSASVAGRVEVVASGLKRGRYTLTLVADDQPARNARCLARIGTVQRTRGGWASFEGAIPKELRCYQGAGVFLGPVPTGPGAYHLVVGVKSAPAAWNGSRTFLRRKLRLR